MIGSMCAGELEEAERRLAEYPPAQLRTDTHRQGIVRQETKGMEKTQQTIEKGGMR